MNSRGDEEQTVIMTVGCPGSGKTTFAAQLDPERWVRLELDTFRQAFWHSKKVYHDAVQTDRDPAAKGPHPMSTMLRNSYRQALDVAVRSRWNVVMSNMHIWPGSFQPYLGVLEANRVVPRLKVFLTPYEELLARNARRTPEDWIDPAYLAKCHASLHAPDAWWRSHPTVEIIH